jgi:S-formylglutathione hydrolase FrmB
VVIGWSVLLGIVTAAAWVNHHYAYLPDVGAIVGQRAVDQASPATVDRVARQDAAAPARPPAHGLVELVTIPGTASGFDARPAQVYLPPAWFRSPRPALPVVELLHGTPGTPEDWTRAGRADVTADRWAGAHGGMAPIIVMPDPNGGFTADTECVDGGRSRAETYLATDVPAWVVRHLGAAAGRRSWVVAGNSEGGYCALDLALRHPDRYGTFLDFSGLDRPTFPGGAARLFRGSTNAVTEHTAAWILTSHRPAEPLAAWFEVGSADGANTASARRIAALAASAGIETHIVILPRSGHTWRVWERAFRDAFGWTAYRTGLTPAVEPYPAPPAGSRGA